MHEFALALKFYESAERLIDPVSMTFVKLLNDMSAAHQELGSLAKAMAIRRRAADLYARQPDPDSFTKATMDFNLGRLHFLMEGFTKSETLFRKACDIFEEKLGRDHPQSMEAHLWWQKAKTAATAAGSF
jgi:tetratricopeptide (TPR) repeat protein